MSKEEEEMEGMAKLLGAWVMVWVTGPLGTSPTRSLKPKETNQ